MRECLRLDAARADIRANLGNLLATIGRPGEAEDAYREALDTDPRFRPARLGLARLLNEIGHMSVACAEANILIEQNRQDAEAWNILGMAKNSLGLDDLAEEAYRTALGLQPDYAVARHNLGAFLASRSRSVRKSMSPCSRSVRTAARGLSGISASSRRVRRAASTRAGSTSSWFAWGAPCAGAGAAPSNEQRPR